MKCIKVVGQGVPVRLPNEEAERAIAEGDGQYCSKSHWREWYREQDKEPLRQQRL